MNTLEKRIADYIRQCLVHGIPLAVAEEMLGRMFPMQRLLVAALLEEAAVR